MANKNSRIALWISFLKNNGQLMPGLELGEVESTAFFTASEIRDEQNKCRKPRNRNGSTRNLKMIPYTRVICTLQAYTPAHPHIYTHTYINFILIRISR